MAGEYGVNIKFRAIGLSQLDKAKAKVKELESSVSSIRSLDLSKAIKGKVGDQIAEATGQIKRYAQQLNQTGKVVGQTQQQQEAAVEAFKNLRSQVKIGGRDYDLLTQAIIRQNKAIDEQNKKLGINQKKRKADPRGRSAALKSGLISGAFPMLFGQGPLGGAAGFAGGYIGTRMGGQQGGFAGGLVATAALQQITEAIKGLNALGTALEPFTLNIDKINQSIGLANTPTGEYLKLLEQTKGKQAAFNAAMIEMERVVGEDGVQALQNFGNETKELQNIFQKFLTGIAATAAKILVGSEEETPSNIIGLRRLFLLGDARERMLETGDAELKALFDELDQRQNQADRKATQNKILALELTHLENEALKLQGLEFDLITKSVDKKNKLLQNSIQFGSEEAKIMQQMLEFEEAARLKLKDISEEELQRKLEEYENTLRQNLELERMVKLYTNIANSIETGVVNAIQGAIDGTKTLGDVASSVFRQIQTSLIRFGVDAFLGGLPGFGKFFRANGGPVSSSSSYIVGERGPELFTPNTGGRITSNADLNTGSTNIVVNVDASGSSVEGDNERSRELGQMLSAAIQSELIKQKRPGGLLT